MTSILLDDDGKVIFAIQLMEMSNRAKQNAIDTLQRAAYFEAVLDDNGIPVNIDVTVTRN